MLEPYPFVGERRRRKTSGATSTHARNTAVVSLHPRRAAARCGTSRIGEAAMTTLELTRPEIRARAASATPVWPRKTREIHNHHMDSTVWNELRFRPDDVVVGTYAKSGTTWTQQIVGQLVFRGRPDVDVAALSPWLDLRVPPKAVKLGLLEAQAHRRFMKNHPPGGAPLFHPPGKNPYNRRGGG